MTGVQRCALPICYGVEVEGDFDQIASFRRFLLFVRDTIRYRKPMFPDIHWIAMANHVGYSVKNGMKFDYIFATENFNDGMKHVLAQSPLVHEVDVDAMPRFNESEGHGPKRAHPVADCVDALSVYIMPEHTGLPNEGDQIHRTRTFRTNRLVPAVMWTMPLHAEHHAHPGVPYHALPALHEWLAPRLEHTSSGYFAFHVDAAARALRLR